MQPNVRIYKRDSRDGPIGRADDSTVPVNLDIAIEQRLPDAVEVAAYYVVAEALTNAAKHAQASRVTVSADAATTQTSSVDL